MNKHKDRPIGRSLYLVEVAGIEPASESDVENASTTHSPD